MGYGIKDFFDAELFVKHVAVDNVILGYHDKELKVLLQRPAGFSKWTVTGGFVRKTETIEEAAASIAFGRTGLKGLFFQQFRCFGSPDRNKDEEFTPERLSRITGVAMPADLWLFDYCVSLGFYTLTEFSKVHVNKGPFDDEIGWWPIGGLPPMLYDHAMLIEEALKALRIHIYHFPIGYELLPEKFTMPEIHSLYETILDKALDSRNFTRRLLSTGIVQKLKETRSIGAHRSPFLYKFVKTRYEAALTHGMFLAF